MIDLSKEAEEYRKKWLFLKSGNTINDTFIAGANSKYVQAKAIQAQIDVLEPYLEWNPEVAFSVQTDINRLQKQLKQLENE
jgi:hypothetical protein